MTDVPAVPSPALASARRAEEPTYLAAYMPWADIGDQEISLGPVTIWDYYTHADQKIKDPKIREQLDKILACYVDRDGKPVQSVAMLSHGAVDFRALNDAEKEAIQRAADAFVFAIIYPNTADLIQYNIWTQATPSSDRYQFYMQNFTPGGKYVTVRAGVVSDMMPIASLRFNKPWALGGFRSRPDENLIAAVGRVLDPASPEDDRRRIMRSLEWFRMAHTQGDNVHILSKVIMMATAFETLLQVGREREKAKFIRTKIEEKFNYSRCITDVRQELSPPIKGQPRVMQPVTLTKAAWWAEDFYDMRSDITHGDNIDPPRVGFAVPFSKKKHLQIDVAAVVFGEMLVWELEQKNLCGPKVNELAQMLQAMGKPEIPVADYIPGAIRMHHNFDDVHEMLGWTTPHDRKKVRKDNDEDD